MPELTPLHPDDFTLLRYTAGDLDDITRHDVNRHIRSCAVCAHILEEIDELDQELKQVMGRSLERRDLEAPELSPDDPFRIRPEATLPERVRHIPADRLAKIAVEASETSGPLSERILEAAGHAGQLKPMLESVNLSQSVNRFGLLYALQGAGRRIADSPLRTLLFAEEALLLLRHGTEADAGDDAEIVLPLLFLRAQAHSLAGQACNWTGDFEQARTHFELSYRAFARVGCDEVSLASVEYNESQRRSFTGLGSEGVVLARRAAATFEDLGMEDNAVRARFAEAHALSTLGKNDEAVEIFRRCQSVFERLELWSNYVASVNAIGVCLVKLGRLDEARREFARALRRVSRERLTSWIAVVRDGLAETFFSAGRFREAAVAYAQATRLYLELGMRSNALIASLYEIESWARQGDAARARHRLQVFQAGVAAQEKLDPSIAAKIQDALLGLNPDLERIARLRQVAEGIVRERQRALA